MRTAAILTRLSYKLDGDKPINIPALFDDIRPAVGDSYYDITLTPEWPPVPNLIVVEAVVSPETLAVIQLHPLYAYGAVLWTNEEEKNQVPSEVKFRALLKHLTRRIQNKFPDTSEDEVRETYLGGNINGRTMAQIAEALITKLRSLPPNPSVVQPLKEQ